MLILRNFSKLFITVGSIMAFLTVFILGLIYLNDGVVQFLPTKTLDNLKLLKDYAVLFTLVVVGFGFACRRTLLLFVPFCILAVLAIGFSFPALF